MERNESNTVLVTVVVMFIAVLSGGVICSALELPPPDASTPEKCKAERCVVGSYLISLYDFNLSGQTFGADLWLWTHTSLERERNPLETMEFTNENNCWAVT